jgi:hypothetical protein
MVRKKGGGTSAAAGRSTAERREVDDRIGVGDVLVQVVVDERTATRTRGCRRRESSGWAWA